MVLDTLGRPRAAAALLVALAGVLAVVNGLDVPLSVPALQRATGHRYLDMCAFCSSRRVMAELVGLGERGRLMQGLLFGTIDVVIPALSCVAGLAVLATLTRGARRSRWLLLLPCVAAALDLAENAAIIGLLLRYPAPSPRLAGFAGVVSGLKFAAYAAVLLAIAAAAVARSVRRREQAP